MNKRLDGGLSYIYENKYGVYQRLDWGQTEEMMNGGRGRKTNKKIK